MITKVLLTEQVDCWGLGDGSLIDNFKEIDPVSGNLVEIEDEEKIDALLAPYIGTEVMIMKDGNVYASDGTYLGDYYV